MKLFHPNRQKSTHSCIYLSSASVDFLVHSPPLSSINVADLPVMEHSSGVRYISACNCGRKQGPRDDPFTVRAANHDFYQLLGDECGCSHYDRIQFPIFQPSTKDFR